MGVRGGVRWGFGGVGRTQVEVTGPREYSLLQVVQPGKNNAKSSSSICEKI